MPWLKENYGRDVITACVDTGGIDAAGGATALERTREGSRRDRTRAHRRQAGLLRHRHSLPDRRQRPCAARPTRSVSAPNVVCRQSDWRKSRPSAARRRSRTAARPPATTRCVSKWHLRTLNPGSRSRWHRYATTTGYATSSSQYLEKNGLPLPAQGSAYSINRGLWGITIGGQETLTSDKLDSGIRLGAVGECIQSTDGNCPGTRWSSQAGVPVALDGEALVTGRTDRKTRGAGRQLRHRSRHSPGRHRARHQGSRRVRGAGGNHADHGAPRTREAGAQRAAGTDQGQRCRRLRRPRARRQAAGSRLRRHRGTADIVAATRHRHRASLPCGPASCSSKASSSPHSLLAATKGVYGESAGEWTASDALGYARILSLPGSLQTRAGQRGGAPS